jgi:hypothetical protein
MVSVQNIRARDQDVLANRSELETVSYSFGMPVLHLFG